MPSAPFAGGLKKVIKKRHNSTLFRGIRGEILFRSNPPVLILDDVIWLTKTGLKMKVMLQTRLKPSCGDIDKMSASFANFLSYLIVEW
jgi:hypothetical protein